MKTCWSTRSDIARPLACALGFIAVATLSSPATAIDRIAARAGVSPSTAIAPNPLLTIDQNRVTVVERIVATWGDALAASVAGRTRDQLQVLLFGLRSDHLLAASLAGSLEGLR